MKDDLAADGDAALVRAQVIASVGEAKGVAESLQRLAAIAMEELLGLLVIADALLREHRKGGFASHVGNPVHADAAKQTVILSQVSRYGAEMAREQNHGRIEIVGLTGVPAIFDRGGQRVETGRKRPQARRIERLLESESETVGHGIG